MIHVEICVNILFIFSVSALTVFQSWFFRDGNVVFFSDKILFIIYILIFLVVLVFVL